MEMFAIGLVVLFVEEEPLGYFFMVERMLLGNVGHARTSANLVYRSQQENKNDFWTWYDKAQAIAQELDADYWEDGFSYLFTTPHILFPNKPKNMHWKVYKEKREKFIKYVTKGNVINHKGLMKVMNRHRIY